MPNTSVTHLECSLCSRKYRGRQALEPLRVRRTAARPLRSARACAKPGRSTASPPRPIRCGVMRPSCPVQHETSIISLGEGMTPLLAGAADRRAHRRARPADQRRRPESHRLVQSARAVLRRLDVRGAGHPQSWRSLRPATPPARWRPMRRRPGSKPTSSCRSDVPQANFIECKAYGAHVTLVDGLISDCGRIVAERGPARRLVRHLDAQRALSHRRQEDHGLRSGRAAGLGTAGRDLLSDRRRRRHDRHVEGVRGDGSAGLDRRRSGRR